VKEMKTEVRVVLLEGAMSKGSFYKWEKASKWMSPGTSRKNTTLQTHLVL
jgi:hypothetical protein